MPVRDGRVWIRIIRALCAFGIAGFAIGVVATAVTLPFQLHDPIEVSAAIKTSILDAPPGPTAVDDRGREVPGDAAAFSIGSPRVVAHGTLRHPRLVDVAANVGPNLVAELLILAGLLPLGRIARRAAAGLEFSAADVRDLRLLGLLIAVGGIAHDGLQRAASAHLAGRFLPHGWPRPGAYHLPLSFLAVGALLLALAEVFQRGRAYREDAEATI